MNRLTDEQKALIQTVLYAAADHATDTLEQDGMTDPEYIAEIRAGIDLVEKLLLPEQYDDLSK